MAIVFLSGMYTLQSNIKRINRAFKPFHQIDTSDGDAKCVLAVNVLLGSTYLSRRLSSRKSVGIYTARFCM